MIRPTLQRLAWLNLLAALPLLGCAATDTAAVQVQAVAQAATSPTLSTGDAAFMDTAAHAGIEAVAFGQLARTQASRADVRDLALRTVTSRTTFNQELTRLAAAKHIVPPLDMDLAHQQAYAALQALHGRAFDRAYLDDRATNNRTMLGVFRDEAAHGTDPQVRGFASRLVPRIAQDLNDVERLGGHPTQAA